MAKCIWSIVAALLLVGCGADAPADDPAQAGAIDPTGEEQIIPVMGPPVHVLAFGDSLFAGYGVGRENSYPAQLQSALRARGINAQVANAGVSGDTTAAGLNRLKFTLDAQDQLPDLFILELGGNDLLRGLSPEETRRNLAAMLDEVTQRKIPVLIMGMRAPPNYGPEYQAQFDALYADLAREYQAQIIPFWLEAIYQDPKLFQADRIHPTEDGIGQLVAATLDQVAAALPDKEAEPG